MQTITQFKQKIKDANRNFDWTGFLSLIIIQSATLVIIGYAFNIAVSQLVPLMMGSVIGAFIYILLVWLQELK